MAIKKDAVLNLQAGVEFPPSLFILVGAGGTGGYILPHIARISYVIEQLTDKKVPIVVIDPDTVETRATLTDRIL